MINGQCECGKVQYQINGEINEDGQLRQDVLTIKEGIFAVGLSVTADAVTRG